MKREKRLDIRLLYTTLGLALCLTACKKERAFVGIWRTEIDTEVSTDIHRVMFFSDQTCSWNDSIYSKTDSVWRQGSIGGSFSVDGDDILNAAFSKTIPAKDTTAQDSVYSFQRSFKKEDDRRLYCEELDAFFDFVQRLR
ncbi:MAG: hypothetical protein K2L03_04830 [Bacteroidales bacterium]|nr:hypothetical protein [Bacteroidales bacterium]